MRFLLKLGFLVVAGLLIIPVITGQGSGNGNTLGAGEAVSAARQTIGDLSHFCDREPDACRAGRDLIHAAGVQARQGAKLAYEFLDKQFGTQKTAPDAIETGSIKPAN